MNPMTRREFLARSTGGVAVLTASGVEGALPSSALCAGAPADETAARWPIAVFSKVHHNELGLNYEATADMVVAAGMDGIDCPVRPGGQVVPERTAEDLPRLAEILRQRGRRIYKLTTHITGTQSTHTETILRTAARLGIRYYRLGSFAISDRQAPDARLREIRSQLKDLAALNRELGVCGLLQNHIGGNVGAEVWDHYEIVRDYDPRDLALAFDIGHATAVLGDGWHAVMRLTRSHFGVAYVKDYNRATKQWVALGKGSIDRRYFQVARQFGYQGFISLHFEYEVPGAKGPEHTRQMLAAMQRDVQVLKGWLADVV